MDVFSMMGYHDQERGAWGDATCGMRCYFADDEYHAGEGDETLPSASRAAAPLCARDEQRNGDIGKTTGAGTVNPQRLRSPRWHFDGGGAGGWSQAGW